MIEQLIKDRRKDLEGIIEWLQNEATSIRTGRANPDMVSDIVIDYMGTPLRIKEVAAISTPDPRSIAIQPWDKGALAAIEKGIRESSLQLSPVVDGVAVRLTVPALTQERRLEYTKLLGTKTEEARIRVRQLREDILKKVQSAVKEKTAREDDVHRAKEQLQKIVDEYNGKLDDIAKKKESELMSV
ncbi:MAG: ribosome recycling factor [Candidatus Pacebacteria bacterium]|nr:ribosome recycling factor [Candidatus Paceibacterota bacterium]